LAFSTSLHIRLARGRRGPDPGSPVCTGSFRRARQARGRLAVDLKVVFQHIGTLAVVVDDQDLVGQEQNHVALIVGPLQLQVDRFELEGDVVAEGAVEAELVVIAGKQVFQSPDDREGRRLARAFLFLEHPVRLFDGQIDPRSSVSENAGHIFGWLSSALAMAGHQDPPRWLSARISTVRSAASMTSGGLTSAMSQRV
jgi:hypothetical protein